MIDILLLLYVNTLVLCMGYELLGLTFQYPNVILVNCHGFVIYHFFRSQIVFELFQAGHK